MVEAVLVEIHETFFEPHIYETLWSASSKCREICRDKIHRKYYYKLFDKCSTFLKNKMNSVEVNIVGEYPGSRYRIYFDDQ